MSGSYPNRRPRIALLAPFSFGNLGNAAMQRALVERFSQLFPSSELLGCYVDPLNREFPAVEPFPFHRDVNVSVKAAPSLSKKLPSGLPPTPSTSQSSTSPRAVLKSLPGMSRIASALRSWFDTFRSFLREIFFLKNSYQFADTIDLFIVGGGGQLDDLWGGPWSLPYSLFTWALLAKLRGKPFLVLNVGAESVTTFAGRWFLRKVLFYAQFRSFRDSTSQNIAISLGSPEPNFVFPDLAFSLTPNLLPLRSASALAPLVVGISPMSYGDPRHWPSQKPAAFANYCQVLAETAARLANSGNSVVLFPTQIRMDAILLQEVYAAAVPLLHPEAHARLRIAELCSLTDCLELLPTFDLVLASRFHGVLLPILTGIPVLAISSESKVTDLMTEFGINQFQVSFESVSVSQIEILLQQLISLRGDLRDLFLSRSRQMRTLLNQQFSELQEDHLAPLLKKFSGSLSNATPFR